MITATIFEAKTKLSELVKKACAGETVIITSGRKKIPVARLEPINCPAAYPKIRSAAVFANRMVLAASIVMMPSDAVSASTR